MNSEEQGAFLPGKIKENIWTWTWRTFWETQVVEEVILGQEKPGAKAEKRRSTGCVSGTTHDLFTCLP